MLHIQTPVSAYIQKCSYLDERSYILDSAAFQTQTGKGLAPPSHVAGCVQCVHVVTTAELVGYKAPGTQLPTPF